MYWKNTKDAVAIELVQKKDLAGHPLQAHFQAADFQAKANSCFLAIDPQGSLEKVIAAKPKANPKAWLELGSFLANRLSPDFTYQFVDPLSESEHYELALGWGLGQYHYQQYTKAKKHPAKLLACEDAFIRKLEIEVEAARQAKDWINTPANDLNPTTFAAIAQDIAQKHGAEFQEIVGENLLKENFPCIHAVGRGSVHPPRFVELKRARPGAKKLALIGKAVCFDTGGYNLKPGPYIRNMKKDMGGGALALALFDAICKADLDYDLQLLLPMVENRVSHDAFMPGEVLPTRKGIKVEIDNTDAEGRLVLCDAITYAEEHQPDMILDFATLTGACRVALGPDLPGFFTNNDNWAETLQKVSWKVQDPVWRLPLWKPYEGMLKSKVADITNSASSSFAGAITAALYLNKFVEDAKKWIHVDTYCWSENGALGTKAGADCQSLRAMYHFLQNI